MQALRWVLFPFSILYGIIGAVRNWCFDAGLISVYKIPVKSICIGNLSTGGTGKTPHTAFLAEYLSGKYNLAILSRGYGRKTNGFRWVNENNSSDDVGDEPLTYARAFKDKLQVAVCESRKEGIEQILKEKPAVDLILLDDAFQHRKVRAGLNILLTEYYKPFSKDFVLPTGNLREFRSGHKRADLVVITKCPENVPVEIKQAMVKEMNIPIDRVFFSKINYKEPVSFEGNPLKEKPGKILLVTGIANPEPLKNDLVEDYELSHISFSDHHDFTADDIQAIQQKFDTFASGESIILTTEKDFVRLRNHSSELKIDKYPWYYISISISLDDEEKFKTIIDQYVGTI